MPGHPIPPGSTEQAKADIAVLEKLVDEHDAIFLLMDSRESRWLPTVLGAAKGKVRAIPMARGTCSLTLVPDRNERCAWIRHLPRDASWGAQGSNRRTSARVLLLQRYRCPRRCTRSFLIRESQKFTDVSIISR